MRFHVCDHPQPLATKANGLLIGRCRSWELGSFSVAKDIRRSNERTNIVICCGFRSDLGSLGRARRIEPDGAGEDRSKSDRQLDQRAVSGKLLPEYRALERQL